MSKNLVIVESPAKARTIERYLGKDFEVLASYGHVRDLVPKGGAVDPEHGFAMKYQLIARNSKHVNNIARAARKATALYLATDPDREGEAISWHVCNVLREKGVLTGKGVHRVVFHEITQSAISEAMAAPRELSESLINAQQARRALDYLVGFNLSPLLWKKIRRGLSAGRVQSPALRLIVEREEEITAFEPREYWTIAAEAAVEERRADAPGQAAPNREAPTIRARLTHYAGEKVQQFTFTDEVSAREAEAEIRREADGVLTVAGVEKKKRQRHPAAPFTTSTLQQEAARKLRFSAQKTMSVAQRLYEDGLITYMRTDSVTLAGTAIAELRTVIGERYGPENLPRSPRQYRTRAKNAQEAHEAVRPTSAARLPQELKPSLPSDQRRLYDLIWKRTMASQMSSAVFDTVRLDLAAGMSGDGNHRFRATGSVLVKPGFMLVYREGGNDNAGAKPGGAAATFDKDDRILPPLEAGERLDLRKLLSEQHFTEPPPRYSEATLVRALEEYGIGRPSTYANIISTLRNREYVEMQSRRFVPTDVGKIVNRFLTDNFAQYVDYEFTARMEDALDAISRGESEWVPLLEDFWKPFQKQVHHTETTVTRAQAAQARPLGTHPENGRAVAVRMGRYGPFVQVGTREDEEKPLFASLRPGQKMDRISLEEALELFKLPRELGKTEDGLPVSANIGRYGPYVRYGNKFVNLRDEDPYTIELPRALELIAEHAAANRALREFPEAGIEVRKGRYGPYVTDGKKNASVPKGRKPEELTLEECRELIAAAPQRRGRGRRRTGGGARRGRGRSSAKGS